MYRGVSDKYKKKLRTPSDWEWDGINEFQVIKGEVGEYWGWRRRGVVIKYFIDPAKI